MPLFPLRNPANRNRSDVDLEGDYSHPPYERTTPALEVMFGDWLRSRIRTHISAITNDGQSLGISQKHIEKPKPWLIYIAYPLDPALQISLPNWYRYLLRLRTPSPTPICFVKIAVLYRLSLSLSSPHQQMCRPLFFAYAYEGVLWTKHKFFMFFTGDHQ